MLPLVLQAVEYFVTEGAKRKSKSPVDDLETRPSGNAKVIEISQGELMERKDV
jgi:hypothetical protein